MNKQKFNIGDIIVCVDNLGLKLDLTIGKSYKALDIYSDSNIYHVEIISDDDDNGTLCVFCSRFVTSTEYKNIRRKEKLENISNLVLN